MKNFRCPVCGEWISVPRYTIDYVHKCIKADKTRMTTRKEFWKIPGRVSLKIDKKDHWQNLGMNPRMPDKKKSAAAIKKNLHYQTNVDTFIELG